MMIGNNLLVVPVLEENSSSRFIWFPTGNWYNIFDGKEYNNKNK